MPTDYGNSHKSKRDKPVSADAEKPKQEKIISGEVIQKKQGIGHRFKKVFFGGDFRGAASYVVADVLLPALRNLLVDTATKGIEKAVYGDTRPNRRPLGYGYTSRIQYNSPLTRPDLRPARLPDQGPLQNLRREPNQMIVPTRDEAEQVMERMIDILDTYDAASVLDLYDLLGLPSSAIDNKWGWRNLNTAEVLQVREGFLLSLPPVEEL